MEIYNKRVAHTHRSSLGVLYFDNLVQPFGFIIEDEPREVKVLGETRIPTGRYRLGIRKEDTPLTLTHRLMKYYRGWFTYHIEVLDVPGFTDIYFHMVNNEYHTGGCQGGSKEPYINREGEFACRNSTVMMKEFYARVYPLLEKGEDVYYTVIDE